ncbi:hypothetical protein QBC43DRAFT_318732 [Cladorrhinum sp. PSN259]|nr:hypothetical protein QBC43DRAFT_318732 [Cladorrhinum sp. PSN259]
MTSEEKTSTSSSSEPPHLPNWGQMCWVEIPCTDLSRVIAFYRNVLSWEIADPGSPEGSIPAMNPGNEALHSFKTGHLHGAFVKMADESYVANVADDAVPFKSSVLAYYAADSIDETLKKVEQFGGRVHVPKTKILDGSMGWFARFVDSEGNLQGIWAKNDK